MLNWGFKNSFIEIEFTCYTIYSFKMYNLSFFFFLVQSLVGTTITELNFRTFYHFSKKPHTLDIIDLIPLVIPAVSNCISIFCLHRFGCSGHFMKMKLHNMWFLLLASFTWQCFQGSTLKFMYPCLIPCCGPVLFHYMDEPQFAFVL